MTQFEIPVKKYGVQNAVLSKGWFQNI